MEDSELADLVASAKRGDERACAELTQWAMAQLRAGSAAPSARSAAAIAVDALRQAIHSRTDSNNPPKSGWFARLLQIDERLRHSRYFPDLNTTRSLHMEPGSDAFADSSCWNPKDKDNGSISSFTSSPTTPPTELTRLTQHCLAALPEQERTLLERRYWTGCSLQDIASRCHCSQADVARQLRQALASFFREIAGEEGGRDDSE